MTKNVPNGNNHYEVGNFSQLKILIEHYKLISNILSEC